MDIPKKKKKNCKSGKLSDKEEAEEIFKSGINNWKNTIQKNEIESLELQIG